MVIVEKELRKTFELDESLVFDLAITRMIAVDGISKFPEYYNLVTSQDTQETVNGISADKDNVKDEEAFKTIVLKDKLDKYGLSIVEYLLPTMLEKAKTVLPEGIHSYNDYAEKILNYCNEEEILLAYEVENENGEKEYEKGFVDYVMEFILTGFTLGGSTKTAKKIKVK